MVNTRWALFGVVGTMLSSQSMGCKDESGAQKAPDGKAQPSKTPEGETPEGKTPEAGGLEAQAEPATPIAARVFRELGEAAKLAKTDAHRAVLDKCRAALAQAGGAGVDDALKQIGSEITGKTFTAAAAHEKLAAAFGSTLPVTADDLDMCVQLRGQSLVAAGAAGGAAKGSEEAAAGDGDCQQCQCDGPVINCCGGEVCACSCEDEGGICSPYCECFPGSAKVRTESGAIVRMRDLRVGDRVEVLHEDGTFGFDEIYLFTHKQAEVEAGFVELLLASGERMLVTARHFVPVGASRELLAAEEIEPGHRLWVRSADGVLESTEVLAVSHRVEDGLYNPLTMSGTIVVDGVVASAHSEWFLDGLVSAHAQGRVYQAMFAPVRGLYRILGPALAAKIAEDLGIVDAVRDRTMLWHRRVRALVSA